VKELSPGCVELKAKSFNEGPRMKTTTTTKMKAFPCRKKLFSNMENGGKESKRTIRTLKRHFLIYLRDFLFEEMNNLNLRKLV